MGKLTTEAHLDFDIFDNFLDAVFITNSDGLIKYANSTAAHIADSSTLRLVEKQNLLSALEFTPSFDMNADFLHQGVDASPSYREFSIKSKKGSIGSVNMTTRELKAEKGKYHVFILRDVSVEKTLHEKFQRELGEKNVAITELDRKVFHMSSLVDFNQTTRLLSDANQLINEFIKFVISRMHFGGGFFVKKGSGSRIPQIDFITGYAERKIIHSKIDLIQKALTKIDMEKIPAEVHMQKKMGKEWQNLLEIVSSGSPHTQMLTVRLRVGEEMAIAAFTDLGDKRVLDDHDMNLIRTLAQNTEVMIENAELKFLAITDEMTKLYNKRYLGISFKHEIEKSLQGETLGILVFDIDHFKKFNDTHGHLAGDQVLKSVAEKVKQLCRLTDIPFRYGGEEFVVLLPGTNRENSLIVAERLRRGVESLTVNYEGTSLKVTVSIGVATCPENGTKGDALIKCADEALYAAKHAGRNNVKLYQK